MKISFLLLVIISTIISCTSESEKFTIMTYNIRYSTENDGINYWENRKEKVKGIIDSLNIDVFGLQEALQSQVEYIQNQFPHYEMSGVGRDDGKTKGEYAPVFWKKSKFTLVKNGHFWLREDHTVPGTGWDANINRIATWIILEDNSGEKYFVLNTHYDHQGEEARRNSSLLILKKIEDLSEGLPLVVMGDLNADPESEPYKILEKSDILKDCFSEVNSKDINHGTFAGGFSIENLNDKKIDHIFSNEKLVTLEAHIIFNQYNGYYPSDHLPVMATLIGK